MSERQGVNSGTIDHWIIRGSGKRAEHRAGFGVETPNLRVSEIAIEELRSTERKADAWPPPVNGARKELTSSPVSGLSSLIL